jgi:integrase
LQAALGRSQSGPYLFPATRGAGPYTGLGKARLRILKDTELAWLTPHGLRHSFASIADDLGFSEPTIAAMLGHTGGGVTRGYIHKADPALIAAGDRVAEHIAAAMNGTLASAEVVNLASAAR